MKAFEDCIVFFELLDQYGFDQLPKVLSEYSQRRVPDAHAICDLAQMNYVEVRFNWSVDALLLTKRTRLDALHGDHSGLSHAQGSRQILEQAISQVVDPSLQHGHVLSQSLQPSG